jgi:hypothetical protein
MVSDYQKAKRGRAPDASAPTVLRSRRPHARRVNFMHENRETLRPPGAVSGPEGEGDEQ